jgi:hypothetical protein
MPRYYQFGGSPHRYMSNWDGWYPNYPGRAATSRALGDVIFPMASELNYPGTAWDKLRESQYNLSPPPRGYQKELFYKERPTQGAPEPLSPQQYPQWQARELGFWAGLSDNEKRLAVIAVGGVAALLLLKG